MTETNNKKITIPRITSDTRKTDGWIQGVANDGLSFNAKVFDTGSVHGIDNGRVSKLDIRKDGEIIVNFDRGWDVKPNVHRLRKSQQFDFRL